MTTPLALPLGFSPRRRGFTVAPDEYELRVEQLPLDLSDEVKADSSARWMLGHAQCLSKVLVGGAKKQNYRLDQTEELYDLRSRLDVWLSGLLPGVMARNPHVRFEVVWDLGPFDTLEFLSVAPQGVGHLSLLLLGSQWRDPGLLNGYLGRISAIPELESLRLDLCESAEPDLEDLQLAGLPRSLTALSLVDFDGSPAQLTALTTLRSLHLDCHVTAALFPPLRHLEALSLSRDLPADCRDIASLTPQLTSLELQPTAFELYGDFRNAEVQPCSVADFCFPATLVHLRMSVHCRLKMT